MHPHSLKDSNVSPSERQRKRKGVGTHSLAHNTLRGRGVCWSFGMRLGIIDKLMHSHVPAHNPHKVVSA